MPNSEDFKQARREASQRHRNANRARVNEVSRLANAKRREDPVLRARANASSVKSIVKRKARDPQFKLQENIKSLVLAHLARRKWGKQTKTQQLLGCSYLELMLHLETQFQPGMSVENHGAWHIDHIKPLAHARTLEEFEALFHYTNLQPLWAVDNLKKGSKL